MYVSVIHLVSFCSLNAMYTHSYLYFNSFLVRENININAQIHCFLIHISHFVTLEPLIKMYFN